MDAHRLSTVALVALSVLLILSLVGPAVASPAPISGCPPCSRGFTNAAGAHGLDTEVQRSEATVHVHRNGSATWMVRVVPTNDTVLDRLAANQSLARAVATDSYGVRYGDGIEHELVSVGVTDGAMTMRYRTLDVVREGPFGTQVLTYFRDSPGAYVYTDLGADELTVVAPDGMTVARGFGRVTGDRLTATALPDVRDGPFVVFAPKGSFLPGLLGMLAVASVLGDVIIRNLVYFVVVPGGVLIGGLVGIRRVFDAGTPRDPTRLGYLVAAVGVLVLVGTVLMEPDGLTDVTENLLLGSSGGMVLLALGASVAIRRFRHYLTGRRLVGAGIVLGIIAAIIAFGIRDMSELHRLLSLAVGLLPVLVGIGWVDANETVADGSPSSRLFAGLSVAVLGALVASAPLTALGGTLFIFVPIFLTIAAVVVVGVSIPLYLLGAAGATAERTSGSNSEPGNHRDRS